MELLLGITFGLLCCALISVIKMRTEIDRLETRIQMLEYDKDDQWKVLDGITSPRLRGSR